VLLRDVIDEGKSHGGLDPSDVHVGIEFEGGEQLNLSYSDFTDVLYVAAVSKHQPALTFDINRDGGVDQDDIVAEWNEFLAAEQGWYWLSHADVDGDGILTIKDVCTVAGEVATP
jgi:hypothetical protein